MFPTAILHLTEICVRHGLQHVVLSPGSRVAPLAISFVRHPQIKTYTISDERSAGFIGLGMANQFLSEYGQKNTTALSLVALACTSGTAVYNYAPAVAEAFYQQIPLLVLTADRPPEWIDQQDGQAIRQREIFGKHVKASFELPVDATHPDALWHTERIINEALNLLKSEPFAPVHINIPIREPFYPKADEKLIFPKKIRFITSIQAEKVLSKTVWNDLATQWERTERKLIVVGQDYLRPELLKALALLNQDYKIPIVGDIIANLHPAQNAIQTADIFLMNQDEIWRERLRPDLLITFGKSLISKNLKNFLRQYPARQHWHIQPEGTTADTFQSLTQLITVEPAYFFGQLYADLDFKNMLEIDQEGEETDYHRAWQTAQQKAVRHLNTFFSDKSLPFNEMEAVGAVMEQLPEDCLLHLANSMAVRYANFWGFSNHPKATEIEVFANRGTSGIDGCVSTAVGAALANPARLIVLLIGDLSFFYDRNGLWHNYLPANLRIILLNNHGGNIFRMIDGPALQPELEEYFETNQVLDARQTAIDFKLAYDAVENQKSLAEILNDFFQLSEQAKLLEIFTDKVQNAVVFRSFKRKFAEVDL
jgi:2-succinyl-5-enolpyruvyl-6-hydroxy-3-cyclohexene-1-carboxylate synthase